MPPATSSAGSSPPTPASPASTASTPAPTRVRQLLPSLPYPPPPAGDKADPRTLSFEAFCALFPQIVSGEQTSPSPAARVPVRHPSPSKADGKGPVAQNALSRHPPNE